MLNIIKEEMNEDYKIIHYSNGTVVKQSINAVILPLESAIETSDTQDIMQGFTDSELRDLEIQQNQELLAQQITDIEVALLGGDK